MRHKLDPAAGFETGGTTWTRTNLLDILKDHADTNDGNSARSAIDESADRNAERRMVEECQSGLEWDM